ncbi:MAG: (deoxy)nucleoside triphosphate pyrophosphohydrolase [Bdellovibrionia bacterium]
MKKRVKVGAGVIVREGKLLVARRSAAQVLGGFWEFPGGKLEPEETPEQCIRREIREELALEVSVHQCLGCETYAYPTLEVELWVYLCTTQGEPCLLGSHDTYQWCSPDQLHTFQWAPADCFMVNQIVQQGLPEVRSR